MAVGFNAGTNAVALANAATLSSSTVITVGTQATLLVVTLVFAPVGVSSPGPTGITVTWGGVAMTQQVVEQYTGVDQPATAAIFTLINPASGNHVLTASWTNTVWCYMGAVSFTGTDTVTGVQTADSTSVGSTGTAQNITINSDANGATVALYCNISSSPTTNFQKIWSEQADTPGAVATYQLGGTANTHTFSGANSSSFQAVAGIHIISSGFHSASNRWHRLGR